MKNAVVTGTSTGIGYETVLFLARKGYRVFAAMRDISKGEKLRDTAIAESLAIDVVAMDVCDDESVTDCFSGIAEQGPVDVLVNNAGISGVCPLEFTPIEEHRKIFETNYFGAVRCIQAVAGGMRKRNEGCIVNISSAAGLFAVPTQIPYSASKWAVECLSEAVAHELAPFGVRVVSIEPGVVKTHIFENSAEQSHFHKDSPYVSTMRRIGRIFTAGLKSPLHPQDVAEQIYNSITCETYKFRWPLGADAEQFYAARTTVQPASWIELGASQDEDEFVDTFQKMFGITI
ncbi:MAG: oxidoreductase [Congregibacter sp.]